MTDKQREAFAALMEYARLEEDWRGELYRPKDAFRRLHRIPVGVSVDEWLASARHAALRLGAELEEPDGR